MLFIITSGSYSDYAWERVIDTTKEELDQAVAEWREAMQKWRAESNRVEEEIFGPKYISSGGSHRYSEEWLAKKHDKDLHAKWCASFEKNPMPYFSSFLDKIGSSVDIEEYHVSEYEGA